MASKFLYDQAIEDSNAINQSPEFNWRSLLGIPNTAVGNQFADARKRMTNQNYNPFPGSLYSPHRDFEEMQFSETAQAPEKKGMFSRFTTPLMQILQSQRNNPEENFGLDYYPTRDGRVNYNPAFELHGDMNVASGFGEGLGKAGQKRIDRIQNTVDNFSDQWSNLKESDEAAYDAKLAAHQERLANFKRQQSHYLATQAAKSTPDNVTQDPPSTVDLSTIVDRPVNTGNTGGGQRDTSGWSSPGYSTRGGFAPRQTAAPQHSGAGASRDVRGHHSWADGGRIGYALAGPVGVEQETDFIQGPQGGEEFQETVVEGQEQPSREQLEALSMAIFQLPLDDLDEQQLLVVYQEAMQGQPMEEAVQEDEVQYAAQGGLAGLL